MSSSSSEYLSHILDETQYLITHATGMDKRRFLSDETLKRAFVRSIEIIGEASKKVSDDLKTKTPHIDWRSISGMRDKLIHDYFGIDYDIVWDVVTNKIPELKKDIEEILSADG